MGEENGGAIAKSFAALLAGILVDSPTNFVLLDVKKEIVEAAVANGVCEADYTAATGSSGPDEGEEEEKEDGMDDPVGEKRQDDGADIDEEEEVPEEGDDGTVWNVDYSHGNGKAYRVSILDKRKLKEYTSTFRCSKKAKAIDVVTAVWADGYEALVPQRTCGEQWPETFPGVDAAAASKPLPKNGKQKKGAEHDNLWNSSLSGSDVVLEWRSSRGWQITPWHKKKQMCAMKPQAYMRTTSDHDAIQDRAIKLMIQVGKIRRRHDQDERREHCLSRQRIKQARPRFSEEKGNRIRK